MSDARVPYEAAVAFMQARAAAIAAGRERELVWLIEHPPLYTAGTSAKSEELIEARFPVFESGRGGQMTYHGPGQRVAYVMLDLTRRDRDVGCHVWRLEEWMIRVLARFGVAGERREGRIGVWVVQDGREDKIGAIGVRVRRWVTYHGLALNVTTDLSYFDAIVPCGIEGCQMTSLAQLGTTDQSVAKFARILSESFGSVFGYARTIQIDADRLWSLIDPSPMIAEAQN